MRRLSPKQREMLGEKLADLGNGAVGSLVFGVVLRAEAFTRGTVMLGILIAIAAYWFAVNGEKYFINTGISSPP